MDPEVLETKPGPCPICGMALEPRTVTLAEERNPELEDMTRRFRVSLALTVPLLLLAMGGDAARAPRPPLRARPRAQGVDRAAARDARSSLWGGWPFFERMWTSFRTGHLNMFTLIGIGTGIAWLYSVAAVLVPGVFPASFRGHDGEVGRYFESAAVIVTLVLVGQVLELRARAAHERGDQGPPRPRPEDGAARRRGRRRGGRAARGRAARRPAPRPARRDGPGGRRRPRGDEQRRRVDDHRRAGAGGEGGRARA